MFFVTSARGPVHQSRLCSSIKKSTRVQRVNSCALRRRCKLCCTGPLCLLCLDMCPNSDVFGCGHALCEDCMELHCERSISIPFLRRTNGKIFCPCYGAEIDVPLDFTARWKEAVTASLQEAQTTLKQIERTEPHCPHCDIPYCDFDGCAALSCVACGGFFCAFCSEKMDDNADLHKHILECPLNPSPGDYFGPIHRWKSIVTRNRSLYAIRLLQVDTPQVSRALGMMLLLSQKYAKFIHWCSSLY